MSDDLEDVARARTDVVRARARLSQSVGAVVQRVSPVAVARRTGVRAMEFAKRNPVALGAAGAAASLLLFRKPLVRLIAKATGRGDPALEDKSGDS